MEQQDTNSLKRRASLPPASKKLKSNEGESLPTQHIQYPESNPPSLSESSLDALKSPTPSEFKNLMCVLNEQKAINLKLKEDKRQERSVSISNLINTIEAKKELMPVDFKIKDLTDKFNEQQETHKSLQARILDIENQISSLTVSMESFKQSSNNRKSAIRYDISEMNKSTERHEKALEENITDLERTINFYKKLTGVEIANVEHNKYRCRVRIHHNELIFMLTFVNNSIDYELISHTINGDKLESILKMDINIDLEDAPALVYKVIGSLLQK